MKTALAITVLVMALSLCNLAERLTNRNGNQNGESTTSQNENQPTTNSSPSTIATPPELTNRNENTTANSSSSPVSGGVLDGKAISKPDPPYPPIAKAARASGTVTVQVTVDETGKVISAKAISGHPLLQAAAVQAARQATFKPTLISGKPVKVTGVLTYNFKPE